MSTGDSELCQHALSLCQKLIRIDTTNPPGNERPAADLLATELSEAGLDPQVLESAPGRANVVARLRGTGEEPPLLLTAHLDVVEADAASWTHPPFSGEIVDGFLWGRGALDMKHMAAMSTAIITRLAREGVRPRRDIIFAGVADEEAGCTLGSMWLCDNHPELVRADLALGEVGGFNIQLAGRSFFTVQVAEKGVCWVRARFRGEPGHGSMPREDSAIHRAAAALERLRRKDLPLHSTDVARDFVAAMASAQPAIARPFVRGLFHPAVARRTLRALKDRSVARGLRGILGNTASPTVVRAGSKTNVIPGMAEVEIDGRTLPGQTTADFLRELGDVLGPEAELSVMREMPPVVTEPRESPLLDTIRAVMKEREPESTVVPYMVMGYTDAKAFSRLGTRWYGFAPLKLPPELRFADLYHGTDERVPVDGLAWGTDVLDEVVRRFAVGKGASVGR